jgi:hypothetical protein
MDVLVVTLITILKYVTLGEAVLGALRIFQYCVLKLYANPSLLQNEV